MRVIDRDELREEIDGAAASSSTRSRRWPTRTRISPGAVYLVPEWVDARASRLIPDLNAEVVVYGANSDCDSSKEVAARLVELGYRNVRHCRGQGGVARVRTAARGTARLRCGSTQPPATASRG
jgi:hypothetical protein